MTKRILALVMAFAILATLTIGVSAATVPDATIDPAAKGSLTIYKYDFTQANMDGTTTVNGTDLTTYLNSYASDGLDNAALRNAMTNPNTSAHPGSENPANKPLGNGQTSNGYAIKGVEFSYLKVANIIQYTETEADGTHKAMVLYEMDDNQDVALLAALGLTNNDAYPVESTVDASTGDTQFTPVAGKHYFESDTLINALRAALTANETTVKNALENYMSAQNAPHFTETDANGYAKVENLDLGLYLVVETKVPEMVTTTTAPFFVSVPMTTVNGTVADNGGEEWLYDITLFPKNETGIPSLEKTVRESKEDTGKEADTTGYDSADNGYEHNATGSDNDVFQYQYVSRLPIITSEATAITMYTFVDTLSKGLEYETAAGVNIEWFKDADCTERVDSWGENEGYFTVTYGTGENDATTMTIEMDDGGLDAINHDPDEFYGDRPSTEMGYSRLYMRVTYSCRLNMSDDVIYGDDGNPNTVTLQWQRSNMSYYDTLTDDAHVYTYELDLTKTFDDGQGDPTKVSFKLFNATDGYWVTATENPADSGIYFVNGHEAGTADEDGSKGTTFHPAADGTLKIRGLEDDEYIITETTTDNGYNLLKDNIHFIITAEEDDTRPCQIYAASVDAAGVWQNKYADNFYNGAENGYDQDEMGHYLLTASATIDGSPVTMLASGESENAIVPLTVVNYHVPDLPVTGEMAQTALFIGAGLLFATAAVILFFALKKREKKNEE